MRQSASEFLGSFLLTTFALVSFYIAFHLHDALYPGNFGYRTVIAVFLAYAGFAALHKALHVQDPKDSNSPDVMG